MKKFLCCIVFLAVNLPETFALDGLKEIPVRRSHPNPLLVGGVVTFSVGTALVGSGLLYNLLAGDMSKAGPNQPHDNTGIYVAVVGGAMVVGGIVMICTDQMHHKRLSLISTNPNQIGIAFSLNSR